MIALCVIATLTFAGFMIWQTWFDKDDRD